MWWEFFDWMRQDAGRTDRRVRADRRLEPSSPSTIDGNGKQTWRYRFPVQEFDLGRDKVHDPARPGASGCVAVLVEWSATWWPRTPPRGPLDLKRVASDPHPEPSSRSTASGPATSRRPRRDWRVGRGPWDRRDPARTAPRVICSCACRRGSGQRARRPARPCPARRTWMRRAGSRSRSTTRRSRSRARPARARRTRAPG